MRILKTFGYAAVLAFAASTSGQAQQPLSIGTSPAGSLNHSLGNAIGKVMGDTTGLQARVVPFGGGQKIMPAIVAKRFDLGLHSTSDIWFAYNGKEEFDGQALKDLRTVAVTFSYYLSWIVRNDSPYKTINELIAAGRANPDKLTWGSAGVGSGQHMSGETMIHATKAKMRHVPFRGDAGSVTALLSKSVDFIMAPSTVLVGNIEGGNFRALAVSSKVRAPALKDVPTMAEALKLDIEMQAFNAVATTKGTPKPVIEKLTQAVHAAVKSPAMDKRLRDMGGTPKVTSNEEMAEMIAGHVARWKAFVAEAKIKVD